MGGKSYGIGFITSNGVKGVRFIDETITGETYRKLIEVNLFSEFPRLFNHLASLSARQC